METLLAIITIIQRANGKRLLQNLFSSIVAIVGLTMIIAIMVSATLIGVLINTHIILLQSGMSPVQSLVIIGLSALLMLVILITVLVWRLRCLRRTPVITPEQSPLACHAMATLNAFTNGLMAE